MRGYDLVVRKYQKQALLVRERGFFGKIATYRVIVGREFRFWEYVRHVYGAAAMENAHERVLRNGVKELLINRSK